MRKIEEVLRLKWQEQRSAREIARSVGIGRTTVAQYLARAAAEGLSWPLPEGLDAAALEQRLFGDAEQRLPGQRVAPDWQEVHRELQGKGVTLALLWQDYQERHPDGWQYSQFCAHNREWRGRVPGTASSGDSLLNLRGVPGGDNGPRSIRFEGGRGFN